MNHHAAASIDATLSSLNDGSGPRVEDSIEHLNRSVEFQRLLLAHTTRFYSSQDDIPARIHMAVTHAFICGMASGQAIAESEKLEDMFR